MDELALDTIISGGQTGVDRAGLDAAIELGLAHGGWCPRGRRAEDGRIPDKYVLAETEETNYRKRTEWNVVAADATLILYGSEMSGGTKFTHELTRKHLRPVLCVPLLIDNRPEAVRKRFGMVRPVSPRTVFLWLQSVKIETLNVAGPRESTHPGIYDRAMEFLRSVLRPV